MLLGNNVYFNMYSTMLSVGVENIESMAVTVAFFIFRPNVHHRCSDITSLMLCPVKMLVINTFLQSFRNDCFHPSFLKLHVKYLVFFKLF